MRRDAQSGRRWRVPAMLLAVAALLALLAPLIGIPPDQYDLLDTSARNLPPDRVHPLGTDASGRDLAGVLPYALRVSMTVALLSVCVSTALGATWGIVAGWIGGGVERTMLRLLDVCMSIPRVLLLLALVAFWPQVSVGMLALILGLTGWFDVARLVRADVASLREREWLLAARATGSGVPRLITRHLVPHLAPTLGVSASLGVAASIALETGLSYFGLGIGATEVSLGRLLNQSSTGLIGSWWTIVFPAIVLAALVLACVALGDALRGASHDAQVAA